MDVQKLEYRVGGKRSVNTLGMTAVVCAAIPLIWVGLVTIATLLQRMGVRVPSLGGSVLLMSFWFGLICGFVGLVLGLVAVVSGSRSRRLGLIAIGLVVATFALLQIGK